MYSAMTFWVTGLPRIEHVCSQGSAWTSVGLYHLSHVFTDQIMSPLCFLNTKISLQFSSFIDLACVSTALSTSVSMSVFMLVITTMLVLVAGGIFCVYSVFCQYFVFGSSPPLTDIYTILYCIYNIFTIFVLYLYCTYCMISYPHYTG